MSQTKRLVETKWMVYLTAVLSAIFLVLGYVRTYAAEEEMIFYTEHAGIHAKAGDSASFNLYIAGGEGQYDANLSIQSMPDGFSGYFKDGTYEVTRVHVNPSEDDSVASFQLSIPKEAEDGTYEITLEATTDAGDRAILPIYLEISGLEAGESNFVVEYPDQEGVSGTTFSYSTTIANNTLTDQTYNFSYDAPEGWQVAFKSTSDSTQVSSLTVASGESAGVTITVTPAEKVEAGEYEIKCSAVSAKESLSNQLKVNILGTYNLELTTADGKVSLDAYAKKGSKVKLHVKNSGNIDLENVSLTASAPTGWSVEFDQTIIETLEAGATKEIEATITPDGNALTGDYLTYITASSDTKSSSVEFRITVKTQTVWGFAAIAIIVAVLAGLYMIMKKYGRR